MTMYFCSECRIWLDNTDMVLHNSRCKKCGKSITKKSRQLSDRQIIDNMKQTMRKLNPEKYYKGGGKNDRRNKESDIPKNQDTEQNQTVPMGEI